MKKATQAALCSLAAIATLAMGAQMASADVMQQQQDPKPKITQKWVSTVYTWDPEQGWIPVITCAPTGTNCPLPDPVEN